MRREFIVGVVFTLLLGLLVTATIWVKKPGFFDTDRPYVITTRFREVAGLEEGNDVWVYGTKAGRVGSIRPDGKGGVEVVLEMDYNPVMRDDAEVKIGQRSALGGAIVSIHPGTPASPVSGKTVFEGRSVADPFQEISSAVSELKGPIKETVEEAKKVFADFSKRSESIAKNLDETIDNARVITEDVRAGKGTLGQLLKDEKLYTELKDAVANLKKIGDDADRGGGTIDLLLHDKDMAADLKQTAANVRTISDDLNAGRGTLGRLFKDDGLYKRLDSAAAGLENLVTDARSSKGVLGKLIYDEALAKRLDTITEDVAQVTGKLSRGEGTLGKLINNDDVYNDLRSALKKLGGGADDVRENAPVLTFAGFLFAGF
jgi:phospholipid/cholesterol/gamma-HCH transport system substrate-binding protein